MYINKPIPETSTFLSVNKDLSIVVRKLMDNQRLLKLLYYTEKDCLSAPDLTNEQKFSMVNKQIKLVPLIKVDQDCPNYIVITLRDFTPNATNPVYRDNVIYIQIICHPDHWNMGDFNLRPYKIAGEIDQMLDKSRLSGIGITQFLGCDSLVLNDELMGLSLVYQVIHGEEDKKNPLTE